MQTRTVWATLPDKPLGNADYQHPQGREIACTHKLKITTRFHLNYFFVHLSPD